MAEAFFPMEVVSGRPTFKGQVPEAIADEVCIMVAGKPGSGKSTALNNIFGMDLKTNISSCSVTKEITTRRLTRNGVRLTVIDTPGLGAIDIDKKAVTDAMATTVCGMSYTLLYCLSVAPSSRLTEMDEIIIRNLHATLGKEVWDKCLVLFTFSDTAMLDEFSSDNQKEPYVKYTKEVANAFYSILKGCGSDISKVSVVFDYESNSIFDRTDCEGEIMAIPVGKSVDRMNEPDILPDIIARSEPWTDLVFVEIMMKTREEQRKAFVVLKYGIQVADSAASAVMVGLGADIHVAAEPEMTASEESRVAMVAGAGAAHGFPVHAIVTAIKCVQGHSDVVIIQNIETD